MSEFDVSKCKYYKSNGKCKIPHYQQGIKFTSCNCNEWNCYYKQLQQLKEHCKQIEETNKILYEEKCDLLKENEELKAQNNLFDNGINEQFSKIVELEGRINLLKTENELYKQGHKTEQERRRKFEKCLDRCLSFIEKEVNPYDTLLIIKNDIKEILENE